MTKYTSFDEFDKTTNAKAERCYSTEKYANQDVYGPMFQIGTNWVRTKEFETRKDRTTKKTTKTNELVACYDVVAQLMSFNLEHVTLNTEAKQKAIAIAHTANDVDKQRNLASAFLKKMPQSIVTGPYGIGVWSRTTVKANSEFEFNSDEVFEEASVMARNEYMVHAKEGTETGILGNVAGKQNNMDW
jgi:hypothetical protein